MNAYICKRCGSLNYFSTTTLIRNSYYSLKNGEVVLDGNEDVETLEEDMACFDCLSQDLIDIEDLSKIAKIQLAKLEPKERLEFLPKLRVIDSI